ncbi:response regulator [Gorillibacterium sp. sgz5001074]|uniref:response regulator n=1 Tax=Gorillibacterium sp. sgz5001074 TaxID=3446695 RepID=UPI003F67FFC4
MLKLLIVDDDDWIREGLKRNIPWEEAGIQVAGTASNGQEGWEQVRLLAPDLLLTDIRMPFMDGLQLAEKVAGEYPDIKVVFLTGYDDFAYAKKALQLKASDFVLKYEENDKILESVAAAGRNLEEQRRVSEKVRKSSGLIENQFWSDLLAGSGSEERVKREAELIGLPLRGPFFGAAVIQAEGSKRFNRPNAPENPELMLFSVKNICTELYPGGAEGLHFATYNQRVNIIIQTSDTGDKELLNRRLNTLLEPIREAISRYLKIPVYIGVGAFYEGPGWLPVSYNEALSAVGLKDVASGSGIIWSDEIRYSRSSHQTVIDRVMEYIRKHYANEDLSLSQMAEEVHMTPAYVSTLFKKYKDMTVMDYVTGVRVEKAKELLAGTDLKGYEVAEKVGYANAQYFSVLFKKVTGQSPIEYRQQMQTDR